MLNQNSEIEDPKDQGRLHRKHRLENLYSESFFARRKKLTWRAEILCPSIKTLYNPKTLVDVGCGIGDFVDWWLKKDVNAYGIESSTNVFPASVIPPERMIVQDLRELFSLPMAPVDVVMCIEVAEHIEEEFDDAFCDNLIDLSDVLFMTIAGPEQLGHGHVNLKPQEYWVEKFRTRDYFRRMEKETIVHQNLMPHMKNRWVRAINTNLCIFERSK